MTVAGMDEVGRGSWAGPVVVGAVVLGGPIDGLADSKLLTKRSRERLAEQIRIQAVSWSVGQASVSEIDELGLTAALRLAYERALQAIEVNVTDIIIDGSYNFLPADRRARMLVKADQLIPAVSAASIIAKVWRDRLMCQAAVDYPGYGFGKHVGYGTAAHASALARLGPCSIHRRSFAPIRRYIGAVA